MGTPYLLLRNETTAIAWLSTAAGIGEARAPASGVPRHGVPSASQQLERFTEAAWSMLGDCVLERNPVQYTPCSIAIFGKIYDMSLKSE